MQDLTHALQCPLQSLILRGKYGGQTGKLKPSLSYERNLQLEVLLQQQ